MTRKQKPPASGRKTAGDTPMTEAQHQRALGYFLYNIAPTVAAEFRQILKKAGYVDGPPRTHEEAIRRQINVTVPATLVSMAAAILTTVPGTRRGRPPKASTIEAERLANEIKSNRGASKLVAASSGEDAEQVRSRLRGIKKRSQNSSSEKRARQEEARLDHAIQRAKKERG